MSAIIDGLQNCWAKNLEYGQRLVADLSDEQMVLQPAPEGKAPSNHPAWVFSHLNAYLPVIDGLLNGREFDDPKNHPFGMLSKPESDSSIYASRDDLLTEFTKGHETVAASLANCDDSIFETPMSLERWQGPLPNLGMALPYLMVFHENLHLGQVSAWRRIQGMPSV